ncbi:MAG: DUF3667 domain-containing protein [Gemmatimonadaceae bacterium]|nr:DUF3667 domain-containing protein [Gemmatimonadaceae bacterium]
MTRDPSPDPAARDEPSVPAGGSAPITDAVRRPFSLATLLDLNEEDLAEPLSRAAPPEHRWEQLSLGVAPDTGEATAAEIRTGAASQPPVHETELIPGLDAPGAVEVPVYLAGRTLHELIRSTPPSIRGVALQPVTATSAAPAFGDAPDLSPQERDGASDAPEATHVAPSAIVTRPSHPPALTMTAVGRPRVRMEAPVANFAKAERVPVLWPKRKKPVAVSALPQECARCGAAYDGDRCAACGNDTAVSARARRAGVWNDIVAAFLESDSRAVRTLGALALAPGELTAAFLGSQRRRYLSPLVVVGVTVLVFLLVSSVGSLRPRPDRTLTIGAERATEYPAGLTTPAATNLTVDAPPDLLRDVASTLDYLPMLWLPLMGFGVVAVVAAVRTFHRRNEHAEFVFASHFAAWFVLWWGVVIPLLLLVLKFGLEFAAAADGVGGVRLLDDGRIDGLSVAWNTLRRATIAPAFHSALVAVGIIPWAIVAYRRAFDSTWARAVGAGLLIAAVPLLLLAPFA